MRSRHLPSVPTDGTLASLARPLSLSWGNRCAIQRGFGRPFCDTPKNSRLYGEHSPLWGSNVPFLSAVLLIESWSLYLRLLSSCWGIPLCLTTRFGCPLCAAPKNNCGPSLASSRSIELESDIHYKRVRSSVFHPFVIVPKSTSSKFRARLHQTCLANDHRINNTKFQFQLISYRSKFQVPSSAIARK
jgi:hypothetical protein